MRSRPRDLRDPAGWITPPSVYESLMISNQT
jgi:hypothetical protein